MNSKKSLITIVVIIVVLIAGTLLWRGGYLGGIIGKIVGTTSVFTSPTEGITPVTQPGVEGQTGGQVTGGDEATGGETTGGSIGKMTDEIYVELAVQAAYQVQKDPMGSAQFVKNLLNKYGVTQENLDAYAAKISKDPKQAQAFAQKYAQRLQELQKTGK